MIGVLSRKVGAGLILGLLAVVFSISFTTIIYSGDLAGHLSRGIGFTLAGAAVMALFGAFSLSYRGTIAQPQDVTAAIVAFTAASIAAGWTASGDALFATIAALVAVSTLVTGIGCLVVGRLRLGIVVRFIPYPVLGGFLVATGYLLLTGAIGMTLGQSFDLSTLHLLFAHGSAEKWVPWILAGGLYYAVSRRFRHGLVLPACIVAVLLAFYATLRLTGTGIDVAQDLGLLLGPFGSASFHQEFDLRVVGQANWWTVVQQVPTLLTVMGMSIVGMLLNASAMEVATGEPIDPDRELRGVGITNIAASLFGGLTGYHLLSQTLFARTLGVTDRAAGVAVAVVAVLALFFGATYLSVLPIGVFASVIAFLGIDLLMSWLWFERRRLPTRDYLIVLLILSVAATIGFLPAIAVGILAAAILFVLAYAGIGNVRLKTTAALRRSHVERGGRELAILRDVGERAAIHEVSGYLFFGTAGRMLKEVAETGAGAKDFSLIDFRRVQGIDASAAFALRRYVDQAKAMGTTVVLTGLSDELKTVLERSGIGADGQGPLMIDHLNEGLRTIEDRLIEANPTVPDTDDDFLHELQRAHPSLDLHSCFERMEAKAGDVVFEEGAEADSLAFLVSGVLRVEHLAAPGQPVPVARVLPGALVGETGFYADTHRTARVSAATDCVLLCLTAQALAELEASHPALVADIHRLAASHLARRLARTMSLLQDADL